MTSPLLNEVVLNIPYKEGDPLYEDPLTRPPSGSVIVRASVFPPSKDFPEGDIFVSVQSGGLSTCIEHRHLDQVIEAFVRCKQAIDETLEKQVVEE